MPELVDLWLAQAFNAQDIVAAAAMYHPDARVVRLEHLHGNNTVAQRAEEIRETMAGYIRRKPHMDADYFLDTDNAEVERARNNTMVVFWSPPMMKVIARKTQQALGR